MTARGGPWRSSSILERAWIAPARVGGARIVRMRAFTPFTDVKCFYAPFRQVCPSYAGPLGLLDIRTREHKHMGVRVEPPRARPTDRLTDLPTDRPTDTKSYMYTYICTYIYTYVYV